MYHIFHSVSHWFAFNRKIALSRPSERILRSFPRRETARIYEGKPGDQHPDMYWQVNKK